MLGGRRKTQCISCMTLLIKQLLNIIKNMNESQGLNSSKQLQGVGVAGLTVF